MSQQNPNNTQSNTNNTTIRDQNLDEYHELIVSTLKILYNQLEQARKDIIEIEQIKQQALQDPLGYVELFKAKRAPIPPKLQKIPAIPNVGFRTDHTEFDMRKVVQFATETCKYLIPPSDGQTNQDQPSPYIPLPSNQPPVSQTYKQPWTEQEQRQLVELLELYPEEEVQYQRFLKIAKALGTRTVTQVSSRVQKYFAKLTLNGIPLPGAKNLGNNSKSKKTSNTGGQQTQNSESLHPIRPSSLAINSKKRKQPTGKKDKFGKKNNKSSGGQYLVNTPLVYMSDNDEDGRVSPTALPSNLPGNNNIIKIKLNLPKDSRNQDNSNSGEAAVHNGFKCDGCSSSPIVGIRWHCKRCEPPIDFCDQCAIKGRYKSTFHDRSHFLMKITKAELPEFIDKDYKLDNLRRGEFSYLKD